MIQAINNKEINEMLEWLNMHVGTDWATYQGWILGIAGIGVSLFGLYAGIPALKQKINNTKNKQSAKDIKGGGSGWA